MSTYVQYVAILHKKLCKITATKIRYVTRVTHNNIHIQLLCIRIANQTPSYIPVILDVCITTIANVCL